MRDEVKTMRLSEMKKQKIARPAAHLLHGDKDNTLKKITSLDKETESKEIVAEIQEQVEDSYKGSEPEEEKTSSPEESIQQGLIDFEAVRPASKGIFSSEDETPGDEEEKNYLERR